MPARRPVKRLLRAAALGAACCWALTGGAGATTLRGDSGRDVLRGAAGADRLIGRGGADRLLGGRGPDRLSGGPGRDRLVGGTGRDALFGGTGRDLLVGGPGRDRISCGPGRDRVVADRFDRIVDARPGRPDGSCERVTRSGAARAKPDAFLVAAGDIADCKEGATITAGLVDRLPGTVAVLGDSAYQNGSPDEFARCYEPTWGRHKARSRPAVGNHEYGTPGASGYWDYFGPAAGDRGKGWYSYDLGAWHVVALNSNCTLAGGCQAGSEQERWLRKDLAENDARCTLAYMHHPRFSSGNEHGGSPGVEPLWSALQAARRRRDRPGRPRPRLRAVRAPDRNRDARPATRRAPVRRRHGRAAAAILRHAQALQRGARQHLLGSPAPAAARRIVRLALRGPARELFHRRRVDRLPLSRPFGVR